MRSINTDKKRRPTYKQQWPAITKDSKKQLKPIGPPRYYMMYKKNVPVYSKTPFNEVYPTNYSTNGFSKDGKARPAKTARFLTDTRSLIQ